MYQTAMRGTPAVNGFDSNRVLVPLQVGAADAVAVSGVVVVAALGKAEGDVVGTGAPPGTQDTDIVAATTSSTPARATTGASEGISDLLTPPAASFLSLLDAVA
jgi:hypothetical protein